MASPMIYILLKGADSIPPTPLTLQSIREHEIPPSRLYRLQNYSEIASEFQPSGTRKEKKKK